VHVGVPSFPSSRVPAARVRIAAGPRGRETVLTASAILLESRRTITPAESARLSPLGPGFELQTRLKQ